MADLFTNDSDCKSYYSHLVFVKIEKVRDIYDYFLNRDDIGDKYKQRILSLLQNNICHYEIIIREINLIKNMYNTL